MLALQILLFHFLALTAEGRQSMSLTRGQTREHDRVWKEISTACRGTWSGAMSVYSVQPNNQLSLATRPKTNFRLQVDIDGSTGSWNVWNLERTGDSASIPLQQRPSAPQSQLKLGFDGGIVLRIPNEINEELPRLVFEIGFWDDSIRRTAVFEYKRQKAGFFSGQEQWVLDGISVVQMKRCLAEDFVGQCTNKDDIKILSTKLPRSSEGFWSKLVSIKQHILHLATMKRSTKRENRSLLSTLHTMWPEEANELCKAILPNGIAFCAPRVLLPGNEPIDCTFVCGKKAIVIEYEAKTAHAERVTCHDLTTDTLIKTN